MMKRLELPFVEARLAIKCSTKKNLHSTFLMLLGMRLQVSLIWLCWVRDVKHSRASELILFRMKLFKCQQNS